MDPVLFYSVFNLNQLDSPCHIIFRLKRNLIDEIHELNMEMEEILCEFGLFDTEDGDYDVSVLKRRFKLLQQKLRWSKDYRAIFNKVIETEDDYYAIDNVIQGWLYVYMDPELWCELKEDNGIEYCVDDDKYRPIEKYIGTTYEFMDEILMPYHQNNTKYKPRDYTPVITLDKHIMNTTYEEFMKRNDISSNINMCI